MGERIEFTCVEEGCEREDAIDSTSLNFIQSSTGWDRGECLLCEKHLSERIAGVTIDLSIGSGHTRSDEFQEAREKRRRQRKQGEIDHAKQTSVVRLVDVYHDPEFDEGKVAIEMPSEAKHDLKDLEWQLAHPKYDFSKQTWSVDLKAVERCLEHMRGRGWTVQTTPQIEDAME